MMRLAVEAFMAFQPAFPPSSSQYVKGAYLHLSFGADAEKGSVLKLLFPRSLLCWRLYRRYLALKDKAQR